MADIEISIGLDDGELDREVKQIPGKVRDALGAAGSAAEAAGKKIGGALEAGFQRAITRAQELGNALSTLGTRLTLGVTAPLTALGAAAVKAAIDLDKSRQVLIALTGSTDAASKKFQELQQLARSTPGLTTQAAVSVFAQIKAIGNVTDQTITNLTKSLGKLGSVFDLGDAKDFARNLTQIFSQGFERADIKEALGRVPIFETLLETAFGTKDPAKLKAAQQAGALTLDNFLAGVAGAVQNNPILKNVQESLGSRFQKAFSEIQSALLPLGTRIAETLLPILQRLIPKLIELVDRFSKLSPEVQESAIKFGLLAIAAGPVLGFFGGLLETLAAIGRIGGLLSIFGAGGPSVIIGGLTGVGGAVLGLAGVLAGAGVTAWVLYRRAVADAEKQVEDLKNKAEGFELRRDPVTGQFSRVQVRPAAPFPNTVDFGNTFDPRTRQAISGPRDPRTGLAIDPKTGFLIPFGSEGQAGAATVEEMAKGFKVDLSGFKGGGDGTGKGSRSQSALEIDTQQLKDLNEQIAILRNINSREFQIQIKIDQAQETKRALEELIDLQRQLGLPFDTAGNAKDRLDRLKKVVELRGGPLPVTGTLPGGNLPTTSTGPVALSADQVARFEQLNRLEKEGAKLTIEQSQLRTQELRIQNQVNLGVLTEAEGRKEILKVQAQFRDQMLAALEAQRKLAEETKDFTQVARIDEQIESIRLLGVELNNAQRFMKGFGSATETVGDAFERLGQNVSRAFTSTKNLLGNLGNAIKQFYADLVGSALQNAARSVLGAIFGQGQAGGGRAGGVFGTPGINPNAGGGAASTLGGVLQPLGSIFGGGGGVSAPLSASARTPGFVPGPPGVSGGTGGLGGIFGGLGNLGNLFKGIGFGLPAGSTRGGLASALPLLGVGLGASLGGTSAFGNILGGLGGGLLGVGLTAAPAGLAGSALGFLAPLFSNPITAVVGAALLPGAFLLGKAKQRRADERTSGDFLTAALQGLDDIKRAVESDRLDGFQARDVFESQVIGTFQEQISSLKTKSVRESRLTNQVRDLRNLFDKVVAPEIDKQLRRREIAGKLIPEFALGGIVPGRDMGFDSVMALLRPREMVLTVQQQQNVQSIAGGDVFSRAGVPNAGRDVGGAQAFGTGGTVQRALAGGLIDEPIEINLQVAIGVSKSGAEEMFIVGASGPSGRKMIVNQVRTAQINRELD